MSDESGLPGDVRRARFSADGGDRFLAFWLMLMVTARQSGLGRPRQVDRSIREFFGTSDMRAALETSGTSVVYEQIEDAAALYWASCQSDPQYSSKMLGMGRLSAQDIERKAARELVGTLGCLAESRAKQAAAESLGHLLVNGFLHTFGEGGRAALDAVAATSPELRRFYS